MAFDRTWMGAARFVVLGVLAACTTVRNPAYCDSDKDCVDSVFPFCDLHGEFPESNHKRHTCTTVPEDCPVERCGCEPGAGLSCDVDQLEVCNADGRSSSTATCAMGCSTAAPRCLTFEPSNGLGGPLTEAANEPDVVLPPGARIDTDLGLVQDANGMPISVRSVVIAQDGGTEIRAFMGKSFVIDDPLVSGGRAIAFVAQGPITVRGKLDAGAQAVTKGSGAQDAPALCAGLDGRITSISPEHADGGGGGGHSTAGGAGGGFDAAGGAGGTVILQAFNPLVGGCRGGSFLDMGGTTLRLGGGGGGAVQLVSLHEIDVKDAGFIDVGGGGGSSNAGGGSGGTIVLEAPRVRFSGATTGFAANGGAGGGCGSNGMDGTLTFAPALTPQCPPNQSAARGGNGATRDMPPQAGRIACVPMFCQQPGGFSGGGGGAAGRAKIATMHGTFETSGAPILSAEIATARLQAR